MTDLPAHAARLSVHDMHIVLEGPEDAPVVMLANSLGASLDIWDAQIPALLRHFRVLRYDMRGHGETPATPGPYSIAQLAQDALDILDAHHIEKAHWIGLSLGGLVGQHLLQHAPERIERAVLSNTTAHYPDSAPWNARIATVRAKGLSAIANGTLERWLSDEFRAAEPATVERIKAMMLRTSLAGYIGCAAALRDADLREGLRKVRHDVLVIVGNKDQGTPPEWGWAIADAIPHAQLVTLGAAHISCVEMSDGFNEAVLAFLTAPARARVGKATARRAPAVGGARRPARTGGLTISRATSAKPNKMAKADKKAEKAAKKAAKKLKEEKKLAKAEAKKAKADKAKLAKAGAVRKPAAKKVGTKTAAAKRTPAKRTPAKKAVAKRAPAKKAVVKKTAAKKTVAKKTAVKKTAVKKTAPKTSTVKRAAAKTPSSRKSTPKPRTVRAR